MSSFVRIAVAVSLFGTLTLPAHAAKFDFGDLEWRDKANAGFLPTSGAHSCTGGDLCSSDLDHHKLGGALVYTSDSISATATGWYYGHQVTAMQDHDNDYPAHGAGLGVYHEWGDNSDDNITAGESLKLTFSKPVDISEIDLAADGHNDYGWSRGATFQLTVDGGASQSMLLPRGTGVIAGHDFIGKTFTFSFGGAKGDQFYVSGLTATAVPEPAIPALMLSGIGALALYRRNRKTI